MNKQNVLILGAGPAGLTCAMELSKHKKKVILVEKDKKIGGLAKTLEFKEKNMIFRTDIGPHRFFSKNQYLYDLIKDLLKEKWIIVPRRTRQFINGKFYDYPINAVQAFKNIGLIKSADIFLNYISAVITYKIFKKNIDSFDDYIVANFGRSLGELNMLNYTEKIWGISCKQIHPDWARQRIKGLNLSSALKNAIFKKSGKDTPKTLVDYFYYPLYGTGLIYETMAKNIEKSNKIYTGSYPTKIRHSNNKITEVEVSINGQKHIINPAFLIQSIPITEFLSLLLPIPPKSVIKAAHNLKWRSQVYLFITLDKKSVTKDNWIYFPNKEIPFGRIAEMKNFSKEMSPEDKTSLFVEFFVSENDEIWNTSEENLFKLAMKQFEKLGFFTEKEVRKYYVIKKKKVYPVFDLSYQKNLGIIKKYLANFRNLISIGRPGTFRYNNQDHSIEMGILAAKSIIDGKKYDIENCGLEKEYFEKGSVKIKENKVEKKSYNWMILEDRGCDNGEKE